MLQRELVLINLRSKRCMYFAVLKLNAATTSVDLTCDLLCNALNRENSFQIVVDSLLAASLSLIKLPFPTRVELRHRLATNTTRAHTDLKVLRKRQEKKISHQPQIT